MVSIAGFVFSFIIYGLGIVGVCFLSWKIVNTRKIFAKDFWFTNDEDPTPEEWEDTENQSQAVMNLHFRKGMI